MVQDNCTLLLIFDSIKTHKMTQIRNDTSRGSKIDNFSESVAQGGSNVYSNKTELFPLLCQR